MIIGMTMRSIVARRNSCLERDWGIPDRGSMLDRSDSTETQNRVQVDTARTCDPSLLSFSPLCYRDSFASKTVS
eukprot:764721-Hanusia_phi.AAC.4